MGWTEGKLLRALPDRENWRLEFHPAHGQLRGAYLKKHHVRTWLTWLRARFGAGPGWTSGRREATNVAMLAECQIAAMPLVAFGERLGTSGLLESFVLTAELHEHRPLDDFVRDRFSVASTSGRCRRHGPWGVLLERVAEVARDFHRAGFHHRDLYACHFFVRENPMGQFQVNLIDLQRARHRRWGRRRWLVKDLAQLLYSAPRERVSRGDLLAGALTYLGVNRLGLTEKRFLRQVLAKARRMERRLGAAP